MKRMLITTVRNILCILLAISLFDFVCFAQNSSPVSQEVIKASEAMEQARVLRELGDDNSLTKAENLYLTAATIYRNLNNREGEAVALHFLGLTRINLKQFEKAVSAVTSSLEVFRSLDDKPNAARALALLGSISYEIRDYEKARSLFSQALDVLRETNARLNEYLILGFLGRANEELSKFSESLSNYSRALEIAREVKDSEREMSSLDRIGGLQTRMGLHQKAVETLEELLVLTSKAKNLSFQAYTLYNLAYVLNLQQKLDASLIKYNEALTAARLAELRDLEGMILNNKGHVLSAMEKTDEASVAFTEFLAISRERKNKLGESFALENLGDLFWRSSEYGKAVPFLEQAIVRIKELGDRKRESTLLIRLGESLYGSKQYDQILPKYTESLRISKEIGYRIGEAKALERLGLFYSTVGQFPKATDYYSQSLAVAVSLKDIAIEGDAVIGLAEVAFKLGSFNDAQKRYEQALAMSKKIESPYLEATSLIGLGLVARRNANLEKSRKFLELALKVASNSDEVYRSAQASNELGNTYLELGNFEKAIEFGELSLRSSRSLSDPERVASSLLTIMNAYWRLRNSDRAAFYGKQLVNLVQEARQGLSVYEISIQESFLKDKESYYRTLSDVLIEQGRLLEAQYVLDLLKREEFKDIVRRSDGDPLTTIPYSDVESAALEKIDKLTLLEKELSTLEKKPKETLAVRDRDRLSTLYIEIETVNRAFRMSLEALARNSTTAQSRVSEIQDERNLQRALSQLQLDTGSKVVALYTILGTGVNGHTQGLRKQKDSNFGWVVLVTPSARKAYPIDVNEIEKSVFDLRQSLRNPRIDPRPLAEEFYSRLFRQTSTKQKVTLEDDLAGLFEGNEKPTIMWSLDGILRYLPMSALYDGKSYLIEKYQSVVFTRGSLLSLTGAPEPRSQVLGLGLSEERGGFVALPGVEDELKEIIRVEPEGNGLFNGVIRLNNEFTEDYAIRTWREGSYRLVHVASHYSYNSTQPNLSFLLVGDGQLTFEEMQDKDNLFGKVDMLTLSACDTAMGSANGKEAEGLAYLAQNLGAKSVVASLWQISDAGTPQFMKQFYNNLKTEPAIPKGEAFRQAQLSLIRGSNKTRDLPTTNVNARVGSSSNTRPAVFVKDPNAPYAHPYYWAPFILIGNWR